MIPFKLYIILSICIHDTIFIQFNCNFSKLRIFFKNKNDNRKQMNLIVIFYFEKNGPACDK